MLFDDSHSDGKLSRQFDVLLDTSTIISNLSRTLSLSLSLSLLFAKNDRGYMNVLLSNLVQKTEPTRFVEFIIKDRMTRYCLRHEDDIDENILPFSKRIYLSLDYLIMLFKRLPNRFHLRKKINLANDFLICLHDDAHCVVRHSTTIGSTIINYADDLVRHHQLFQH
jgi:hypothetical protein